MAWDFLAHAVTFRDFMAGDFLGGYRWVGIYLEVFSHALRNWEMTRMVKYLSISRCLYYKGISDGVLYLFYWFVLWICLCHMNLSKKKQAVLNDFVNDLLWTNINISFHLLISQIQQITNIDPIFLSCYDYVYLWADLNTKSNIWLYNMLIKIHIYCILDCNFKT